MRLLGCTLLFAAVAAAEPIYFTADMITGGTYHHLYVDGGSVFQWGVGYPDWSSTWKSCPDWIQQPCSLSGAEQFNGSGGEVTTYASFGGTSVDWFSNRGLLTSFIQWDAAPAFIPDLTTAIGTDSLAPVQRTVSFTGWLRASRIDPVTGQTLPPFLDMAVHGTGDLTFYTVGGMTTSNAGDAWVWSQVSGKLEGWAEPIPEPATAFGCAAALAVIAVCASRRRTRLL